MGYGRRLALRPEWLINLRRTSRRVLAAQSLRDWVAKHGGEPMNMTQPEFARFVLSESESAAQIISAAGIKSQ